MSAVRAWPAGPPQFPPSLGSREHFTQHPLGGGVVATGLASQKLAQIWNPI